MRKYLSYLNGTFVKGFKSIFNKSIDKFKLSDYLYHLQFSVTKIG